MAKKQNPRTNPATPADTAMDGNVDQIREILFGGHMRDYEQRFADLEGRMSQTIDTLSREFEKRLERAIAQFRRDIEKLTDQVRAERKERLAELRENMQDLENLTNQVEAWFAEVDEQFETEGKELRAALKEQNNELASMIHDTRGTADSKVGAESLAQMLIEVAGKLKKEAR